MIRESRKKIFHFFKFFSMRFQVCRRLEARRLHARPFVVKMEKESSPDEKASIRRQNRRSSRRRAANHERRSDLTSPKRRRSPHPQGPDRVETIKEKGPKSAEFGEISL